MRINRKFQRFLAVFMLGVMIILLTGCEKWETFKAEYELFKQELPEIREFFAIKDWSEEQAEHVVPSLSDEVASPMLDMLTHTEIFETPYNGKDRLCTIQSLGNSAAVNEKTRVLTEAEMTAYIKVPMPDGFDAAEMKAHFESCGVEVQVVRCANTAPAGEAFAVNYSGAFADGVYYVNPLVPFTMYVSDEKAATTAEQGHNLVYFTFDDGPWEYTEKLLDILDTYGIKAAFFTLGTQVEKNPAAAASIVSRGHSLGCHTYTHDYEKIYASSASLQSEVEHWENTLADAGIVTPQKIFRFPGGSVGGYLTADKVPAMQNMLEGRGYLIFDWSVSINDAVLYLAPEEQSSYDYIKESFIASLEQRIRINEKKNGAPLIILMHEQVNETVDLLPWIIEYLVDRGFVFGDLANFDGSYMFER